MMRKESNEVTDIMKLDTQRSENNLVKRNMTTMPNTSTCSVVRVNAC